MATGTVTQAMEFSKAGQVIVKLSWLASSVSGTLSTVGIDDNIQKLIRGKYALFAVTEVGETKVPTANYDVSFADAYSCNIFGNETDNRSSGTIEQVSPKVGNLYTARLITSSLNFALSNNSAPSASGTVRLVCVE